MIQNLKSLAQAASPNVCLLHREGLSSASWQSTVPEPRTTGRSVNKPILSSVQWRCLAAPSNDTQTTITNFVVVGRDGVTYIINQIDTFKLCYDSKPRIRAALTITIYQFLEVIGGFWAKRCSTVTFNSILTRPKILQNDYDFHSTDVKSESKWGEIICQRLYGQWTWPTPGLKISLNNEL